MAESKAKMHRLIKKRKTNASGNAEDVDTSASGSMTMLTETSASNGNRYEVFLSFRGPDTRHGFTDHLYDGLLRAGIHTFRDDDELCQGEDIRPEIMAAITNSKVLIPIFSLNYGTSSWCLDELVQIMERKNNNGQMVLPIFYKVKPADVGHQIGSFGKAFDECLLERSSFDPVILEKWKQALLEVSNLKGYEADGVIVREENEQQPWHCSRLWDSEEALKVLKRNKGTDKIEAIDLSKGNSEGLGYFAERDGENYTAEQFKKLTSLRFLIMTGAHLSGDFKDSMEELRWLRWPYCPTSFEVNNFWLKELAVLELKRSKMNEKWEGWNFFMMAEKLKYLDLSHCESLENTDFLSAFKKLEVLILTGCDTLKQIDASIGDMEALLRLELAMCMHLRELPANIGKLKSLQQLDLSNTPSLSALPNSIGSLENLVILDILHSGIEELPNGIGSLRKLQKLHASCCGNLKRIMVESMYNLSSLRHLEFTWCDKLQSLPDLPSGLTYLGITCQSRKLPSLSHLAHLKQLRVEGCGFLQCIQELPSTQLKSSECSQPMDIEESESPQSLNMPFKLELLEVLNCGSIEMLDISQFVHLKTLFVCKCNNLLEVRALDKLIYLESLTISFCGSIKWLDLPKFGCLKKLNVGSCNKLAGIQGLDRLEHLERLDISFVSIERLDLPKFGRLKGLQAEECVNLAEIQGLDRSEYLEWLSIGGCTSMERLNLPKFGRLKELEAEGCKNLAKIQGLDSLEYLESLNIFGCISIEMLDLPKSKSMKELCVSWCKKLAEIQGLDRLESLERLYVSWCLSIERLLLPKSESLKILEARDCKNLVEIQGLDKLEFLEELNIIGCKSLKTIPELSGTRIYRYYEIADREMEEDDWSFDWSFMDYMDFSDE